MSVDRRILFFFNDTATTEIYTLSLHDALPIYIFLMTRAREESVRHGARDGVLRALAVTGGVITSAGMVLAATFGALSVLPLLFLVQLSFLVGFGVLLDTFVVRSLIVPAAVAVVGDRVWWPSRLARRRATEPERELQHV